MTAAHWFGPHSDSSTGSGHPVMFGVPQPAEHFDPFPDGGGYPNGFVKWALMTMNCPDPLDVLHLCSGSMLTGTRVDVRERVFATRTHKTMRASPGVVADCRATPFRSESFDYILADLPYAEDYAANLYDTESSYPQPGQIVKEACRLLRPGGRFGLLHFQVPMIRKPMRIRGVFGVTTGSGYAIRAWTLMEKSVDQLALEVSV